MVQLAPSSSSSIFHVYVHVVYAVCFFFLLRINAYFYDYFYLGPYLYFSFCVDGLVS